MRHGWFLQIISGGWCTFASSYPHLGTVLGVIRNKKGHPFGCPFLLPFLVHLHQRSADHHSLALPTERSEGGRERGERCRWQNHLGPPQSLFCGERRNQVTGGIFRLRKMEHCGLCFDEASGRGRYFPGGFERRRKYRAPQQSDGLLLFIVPI